MVAEKQATKTQAHKVAINPKTQKPLPEGQRFKPGQSGNPNGRKKKEHCVTSLLTAYLKEVPPIKAESGAANTQSFAELLARAMLLGAVRAAQKGQPQLAHEVLDRVEGKAPDKMELTGKDGGPLRVEGSAKLKLAGMLDAMAEKTKAAARWAQK